MGNGTGTGIDGDPRLERLEMRISKIEEILNSVGLVLAVVDKARAVKARHLRFMETLKIAAVTTTAGALAFVAFRWHLGEPLAERHSTTEGGILT